MQHPSAPPKPDEWEDFVGPETISEGVPVARPIYEGINHMEQVRLSSTINVATSNDEQIARIMQQDEGFPSSETMRRRISPQIQLSTSADIGYSDQNTGITATETRPLPNVIIVRREESDIAPGCLAGLTAILCCCAMQ